MLSRLIRVRSLAPFRAVPQRFKSCKSGWVDGGDHATHNDLPVPEGDWRAYNSRMNMRNNLVLITGIIALASSGYMVFFSGIINFNATPPAHWKEDDNAEEC